MSVLKHKENDIWKVISVLPSSKYDYSDPTTTTMADYIGQIYLNKTTGDVFICSDIKDNVYTWVLLGQNPQAKEDKGYLTLNNKQYGLKVQTGDFGTEGYITFVVQG